MDTRVPFILEHGIIIGQWWRRKNVDPDWQQTKRICRITEKGKIVMDMPPKLLPDMEYSVEELLRDWGLVRPVRFLQYTQTDGSTRTQIIAYSGSHYYGKEHWECVGEFKSADIVLHKENLR